ncbi:MAG: cadherin, partial [Thiothrix sp.]
KPDISLTGQVTIKAPHAAGFKVTNLVSTVEGANWVEASRVDAPTEDAQSDYISFSFVGLQGDSARNFAWQAGKEQVVFTFQNAGGCVDGVALMANQDPFNVEKNSANTNPGNQFTNLGWGAVSENHYTGNYGESIKCKR